MRGKKRDDTASIQPYTEDEIIRAIESSGGKIAYTAKLLRCTEQNVYYHIRKSKKLKKALEDARKGFRETLLDLGEVGLFKATKEGKPWAVKFTLQNLGKERGYQQSPQVQIALNIINNYPVLPQLIEAMESANMSPSAVFEKMLQKIQDAHQEALSNGA